MSSYGLRPKTKPSSGYWRDSSGTRLSNGSTGEPRQAAVEVGEPLRHRARAAVDLLTTTVLIPGRSNSKIKAALPFALEENLAEDVENLHFAVGERQENGRLPVCVCRQDKIDGWLSRLSDAGIEPSDHVSGQSRPGENSRHADRSCSTTISSCSTTALTWSSSCRT